MPTASPLLRLRPDDDVAIATRDLHRGEEFALSDSSTLVVASTVPRAHKIALRAIDRGSPVRKYGQVIGVTTRDIAVGQPVHSHNLAFEPGSRDYEFGVDRPALPTTMTGRTFDGYVRGDGRVGTRNAIGVITSVNCSASSARLIADQFRGSGATDVEHIDGVMALTHGSGCGLIPGSEGGDTLLRTLRGYARHPNFGGLLVLGLGCEMVPVAALVEDLNLPPDTVVETLNVQDLGGIRATVRVGSERIRAMMPRVARARRQPVDVSHLVLGLNCGGSDGYSGISANPALGYASDLLVGAGGTSVLAETPEIFGAEHLLTRRAATPEVGQALLERLAWWQDYAAAGGGTLDNNPSPGNKAGGLTTILEKSLGAVAKAGSAELRAVYRYAEQITQRGLGFMDTPGYDPVSVTGLVAGGANLICFTTGRGSVLGSKPSPTVKVATNTPMYERMHEDMDLDAGRIVDGGATVEEVGEELFELLIDVASGRRRSVSEELDLGQDEFQPWQLGAVT